MANPVGIESFQAARAAISSLARKRERTCTLAKRRARRFAALCLVAVSFNQVVVRSTAAPMRFGLSAASRNIGRRFRSVMARSDQRWAGAEPAKCNCEKEKRR